VSHQHPPGELFGQKGMDGRERRSAVDHGPGDSVDVGGTRVAAGVEQGGEGVDLGAGAVEEHHAQLHDPLRAGAESGRLDVHHGESRGTGSSESLHGVEPRPPV
jgi:hypothetical protein